MQPVRYSLLALSLAVGAMCQTVPPEFVLRPLSADEIDRIPTRGRLRFTGVHRAIVREAVLNGAWERQADGRQLWRVALRSPESEALRVHFTGFSVGSGRVWLRGADGTETVGPYTDRGPFGDGEFWSGTVLGEQVTIEYEPDQAQPTAGQAPPFHADKISHQFRQPAASRDALAGLCQLDVTCHADWAESARSVAMIKFETEFGQAACSGALVRTRYSGGLPYFLTADHCVYSDAIARTVEAFWSYQTQQCDGNWPELRFAQRSPVGARYLVSRGTFDGDFSLILLPAVPAGVSFVDWDMVEPQMGAPLTGIHHPKATHKRISFGERFRHYWTLDYSDVPEYNYYEVLWKGGIVEPGSSGSPLFSRPGVLAGVLSYGFEFEGRSLCDVRPSVAGYGRFTSMYPYLKQWLEDAPPTEVALTPTQLRFEGVNAAVTPSGKQIVTVSTNSTTPKSFSVRTADPWITISVTSGTASAGVPFVFDVTPKTNLLARAGKFVAYVDVVSSDGVTRTLTITAEMTVKLSAVTATVEPNPVLAQAPDADGARWVFRLALEEKAGVATQVTMLRINGTDYTQFVRQWFGSDRLEGGERREVQLKTAAPGSAFDQVFEFAGVDAGSGQRWSQTLTVAFR